jgi:rfaE bifunctional protein nucleotidyltransferase chain/domain
MNSKLLQADNLLQAVSDLKNSGKTIVFTNGCFDILHAGHVRYLSAAKSLGDALIVGLNSDASVKIIKGHKRPIVSQEQRAEVLAALSCVNYVVLFDEPDPLNLICAIKPDILVKGADWAEDKIIGADVVKANGGRVERITIVPDISTSEIISRIVSRYC